MVEPQPRTSTTTIVTWVALGLLGVGVLLAVVVVFHTAQAMAEHYPEFAHLKAPLLAAVIAFGLSVEAVLILTALLVGSIHRGRIFDTAGLKLVDALLVTLIIATAIVAAVLPAIPGPPALGLALIGGVLTGTTFVLVVLVLRSLLRQAVSMRVELDEVV